MISQKRTHFKEVFMSENFELPLDKTGAATSNSVKDELHTLPDQNIKCLSPIKGVFFSDSVRIFDIGNNRYLTVKQDFVLTEHYHSLSQFYGKDIAGVIIITNPKVSTNVTVSYQALGDIYIRKDNRIESFVNTRLKDKISSSLFWEIFNNQTKFIPSDAHIDVGDQVGFEYVLYGLEKIRNSILMSDFDMSEKLIEKIDDYAVNLTNILDDRSKEIYQPIIDDFLKDFDKTKLGLDKLENLEPASLELMRTVADENYVFSGVDKYVTLKGITALKEEIYNKMVTKKQTSLGNHYGVIGLPLLTTLENMTNGATVIIDAYDNYSLSSATLFDSSVYPDLVSTSDRWSITKIINNQENRGGVFLGVNLNTSETYIGVLRYTDNSKPNVLWKKQLSEYDVELVIEKLSKHMDDKNNPHKVNKEQVDLGNLENIPPVTRADIAARKPVRKMVTFDALLLFMKAYMNCIKTVEDMQDENCDSDVIRNIKLVFAPCSPCGNCCTPNEPVEIKEEPTNLPTVDPYETLYGWFCQGNAKIGIFADGFGGTFTKEIESNSEDCMNDEDNETPE